LFELYRVFAGSDRDAAADRAHLDALANWVQTNATNEPESWEAAVENCAYAITQQPALWAMAVTDWLTHAERVPLARVVVNRASVEHQQASTPANFVLAALDPAAAALAGRRLCSMSAAPALCIGWALSLAQAFPDHPVAQKSVTTMLTYLSNELPGTTERLLAAAESTSQHLPIIATTLASIREREAELRAIPDLRELHLTREMRWILSRVKREENREIVRDARAGSLWAALMTPRYVKYAMRVVIDHATPTGPSSTSLTMGAMSFGVELPLSETIDPVFGQLRRDLLWRNDR
jgi:hypothetical protein